MTDENAKLSLFDKDKELYQGIRDIKVTPLPQMNLDPRTVAVLNNSGGGNDGTAIYFTTFGRSCWNHTKGNHRTICLTPATDPGDSSGCDHA